MRKLLTVGLTAALGLCLLTGCSGTQSEQQSASQSASASSSGSSSASVSDRGVSSSASAGTEKKPTAAPAALRKQVNKLISQAKVDATFAYLDLESGALYEVGGGKQMVSASMIKLLVLAEFLDEVDAGTLSLDQAYTLKGSDIVGGTGTLQGKGAGTEITLGQAAQHMIAESDNVGTNVLIDAMGMSAINKQADKLGLSGTQLNRRMMDLNGTQNYMTADDAVIILKKIYAGKLASKELSAFAMEALQGQTDASGFLAGLADGETFAHKTGALADPVVQNDGGIVLGEHPCILVAFTSGSQQGGLDLMKQLAQAVEANR